MSELAFRTATELVGMLRRARGVEPRAARAPARARRQARQGAERGRHARRGSARARDADAADRELARGRARGPLHGLPMTIKDTFETAGLRTTAGAPELAEHVPDARRRRRSRGCARAGAIVFGKTNMPFMAGDWQSFNEIFGTTRQSVESGARAGRLVGRRGRGGRGRRQTRSSSAATSAARSACRRTGRGVFGHKPTCGIVPQRGHIPPPPGAFSETDLNVHGPIARSVEDLELGARRARRARTSSTSVGWRLELPPPRRTQPVATTGSRPGFDDADVPRRRRGAARPCSRPRSSACARRASRSTSDARPHLDLLEVAARLPTGC